MNDNSDKTTNRVKFLHRRKLILKILGIAYLIALGITLVTYSVVSIFHGAFKFELLLMMVAGFPAGFFLVFNPDFIGWEVPAGYLLYGVLAISCVVTAKTELVWKILIGIFLIILLLNLSSCLPRAVLFGSGEFH
ncbi:MAG: hypothetical protein AB3N14_09620 [Flavobacteriaceae bacterium]